MNKIPTHTDAATEVDAGVSQDVIAALAAATYPSDVGPVKLSELSPAGAVYMMSYGIKQALRDASTNIKSETQALAIKSVLDPEQLTEEEKAELERLEETFDDGIQDDADRSLFRTVARAYIVAVARKMGVELTADAVKSGVDAYFAPGGTKAPSYPKVKMAYGLTKSVVIEAKLARLKACKDGSINKPKARGEKAAKTDAALAALGLFG